MKRRILIFAVLVLLLGLAACGRGREEGTGIVKKDAGGSKTENTDGEDHTDGKNNTGLWGNVNGNGNSDGNGSGDIFGNDGSGDRPFLSETENPPENNIISLNGFSIDFCDNPESETGTAKIKLDTDAAKPDGCDSDIYRVTVDSQLTEDMHFSFPIPSGYVQEENTAVLFGFGVDYMTENGEEGTYWACMPAEQKNGMAEITINPAEIMSAPYVKKLSPEEYYKNIYSLLHGRNIDFDITLFYFSFKYKEGGHFIAYLPYKFLKHGDNVIKVLDSLEEIYTKYTKTKKYNFSESDFPMNVYIFETQKPKKGEEEKVDEGGYNCLLGYITINSKNITGTYEKDRIESVLEHEFFHYIQMNYHTVFEDTLWIDEMSSTYYENQRFSAGDVDTVKRDVGLAFTSLFPLKNTQNDGYARGPLLKYLCNNFGGEDLIKKLYEGKGTLKKLKELCPDSEKWKTDYYKKLYLGELSSSISPSVFRVSESAYNFVKEIKLYMPEKDELKNADNGEILMGEVTLKMNGQAAGVINISYDKKKLKNLAAFDDPVVICGEGANAYTYILENTKAAELDGTLKGFINQKHENERKINLYQILVISEGSPEKQQNIKVKIVLPMMKVDGIDAFMGEWKDEDGKIMYLQKNGDKVIKKVPGPAWYGGELNCMEYAAEYDESAYTLRGTGLTSWTAPPDSMEIEPSDDKRSLEIDASTAYGEWVAVKTENGKVVEMKYDSKTYTRN